ncbi:MAG: zinc-ribbon and DUF3426 domain-containing protein [Methylovulum sp.]|uniref:zinc-ribbon and DUF3426 domain-containing protein n=1 Tax=Methylovulum sp. TaxID=1916980 RepID=UPI0026223B7D|nr:zinc-ribbon and DUF3426 domain-containing protein [Methylovulum sp.]MDD2722501.1 zinc-ribbon and DUF3426 domain-containing protein [Methylovulum sp.]MDD5125722.1 zinc-ribbon and DUF3426 domain-containing protein [Methylovulum sp.]
MFTRCPNCGHKQELTVGQLRDARAVIACPQCAIRFDALEQLSDIDPETSVVASGQQQPQDLQPELPSLDLELPKPIGLPPTDPSAAQFLGSAQRWMGGGDPLKPNSGKLPGRYSSSEADTPISLPWEQARQAPSPHWRTGALLGGLLLLGQLLFFHGHAISQNLMLRRFCQVLVCPLPTYQNANELAIVSSVLEPSPDGGQLFKAIIINQADYPQTYPNIDLSLQDYAGNMLARRRFRPEDYLLDSKTAVIKPDATVELRLHIAPTTPTVGGYTFDLTY